MPLVARCTATLAGDELVLTMTGGLVHSRIPIDDTMERTEALELINQATMPVRLLWSIDRTSEHLIRRVC